MKIARIKVSLQFKSTQKMKFLGKFIFFTAILLFLFSCNSNTPKRSETEINTVEVACDETFRPIIEQEMRAFHAKYPEAILDTTFVSETQAINLLLQDSFRMAITTRPLSEAEKQSILAQHQLSVESHPFAYDAIALIINNSNPDSLISVNDIRRIVTGQTTEWNQIPGAQTKGNIELVFDDENSSTVRFVRDSICNGGELKGNLKTAKSNPNVIAYVAQVRNAIGIIGVDWIRNFKDTTNLSFDNRVRVMRVSSSSVPEKSNSYQPVQYYIATGDYPLTRQLFISSTEPYMQALNRNFYHYLTDTEGQLIITKSSQLLPVMPVHVKQIDVTD